MRIIFVGRECEIFYFRSSGAEAVLIEDPSGFSSYIETLLQHSDMMIFATNEYTEKISPELIEKLWKRNISVTSLSEKERAFSYTGEILFEKISRAVGINVRNL